MTIGQAFLIAFLTWHIPLLLPFLASKPSYSDAVLAYLVLYPFIYLDYVVINAARDFVSGGGQERLEGSFVAMLPLAPMMWIINVIREAGWWKSWDSWITYFSAASLPLFILHLSRPYMRIDCRRAVDALAPLAVFHFVYAFATMFSTAVAGVDVYRTLLWYFAVYPAALATAVAGGGRLATLAATAIYLAAYALGAEPLLLLLAAVPVVKLRRVYV